MPTRKERRLMEKLARADNAYIANHLKKGITNIRIGRKPDTGDLVLNIQTPDGEYEWPLGMAEKLAAGLDQCADGDPVPAISERHVWSPGVGRVFVSISDRRLPDVQPDPDKDLTIVTAPASYTMRPETAREMANGIRGALVALGRAA